MDNKHLDAYAAGLIDGEGWVATTLAKNANGNRIKRVQIAVGMTDFEAVRWLRDHFQAGSLNDLTDYYTKQGYKPQLRWTVVYRQAYEVAKRLLPFAIVKREPLQEIVDYYESGDLHLTKAKAGSGNGMSKLTDEKVREIRGEYAKGGISQAEVAGRFGVDQTTVSLIVRRKTWAHVE